MGRFFGLIFAVAAFSFLTLPFGCLDRAIQTFRGDPASAQAPAATPDPAAATPDPAAATPDPAAATPDPAAATPDPAAATPDPAAATPDPAAVAPASASAAATASPEPTAADVLNTADTAATVSVGLADEFADDVAILMASRNPEAFKGSVIGPINISVDATDDLPIASAYAEALERGFTSRKGEIKWDKPTGRTDGHIWIVREGSYFKELSGFVRYLPSQSGFSFASIIGATISAEVSPNIDMIAHAEAQRTLAIWAYQKQAQADEKTPLHGRVASKFTFTGLSDATNQPYWETAMFFGHFCSGASFAPNGKAFKGLISFDRGTDGVPVAVRSTIDGVKGKPAPTSFQVREQDLGTFDWRIVAERAGRQAAARHVTTWNANPAEAPAAARKGNRS